MSDVNYTPEQEQILRDAAPVTFFEAGEFAETFGKSQRSVIAKVQSLGLDYIKKPIPAKRPKGATKAELVAEISARLGLETPVNGLDKATASALSTLVDAL